MSESGDNITQNANQRATGNFAFMQQAIQPEATDHFTVACKELLSRAQIAEQHINTYPKTAGFYARSALELMVDTVFEVDNWLTHPGDDTPLMSQIHDKGFKQNLSHGLFPKLKLIIQLGNKAVHGKRSFPQKDALQAVKELHHVLYWFIRTYTPGLDRLNFKTAPFDTALISEKIALDADIAQQALTSIKQVKALEKQLAEQDKAAREAREKELKENADLKAQNQALLAQIEQAKQEAQQAEDSHDYSEQETRDYLIDVLLHEAGWELKNKRDREYPVSGMPISKVNPNGNGLVDYVLWGDDGKAWAVVEAKRTNISAEEGKRQAELYANCLEKECGLRPVIFYTNGYETFLWDDHYYPPRQVQGFYIKAELELMIQRRTSKEGFFADNRGKPESLTAKIDNDITNRHYQKTAITNVLQHMEQEHERKFLLVMATGTGKTRTVISLVDLLTRHGWVKNILFLADRNALLTQAKKNFVKLLERVTCSILDSGQGKTDAKTRLYFSTYPTMKNLLDKPADERPFGVGHFDLIVVDEAHRSVYSKYKQIFDYFDGYLIGLTATPKDEVEKNTYDIFDLSDGEPTFAYSTDEAEFDGYLVPSTKISVATKFVREGIKYDQLSQEEQKEWEDREALEDRDEVLPSEINNFLLNEDTAEKVFAQLMSKDEHGGIHVEGGDVIGKTIIFAANNEHAKFLEKVFNKNYPKWAGKLARVITHAEKYSQSLIDEFTGDDNNPVDFDPKNPTCRIAISVDMLDTGIDVTDVVNLVFFKVVRSKVKFTQMIGRGTRLHPDLFGPGEDKTTFKVFDYCQNFEYFNENPKGIVSNVAKSIGQTIFAKRTLLTTLLDKQLSDEQYVNAHPEDAERLKTLKSYQLDLLHHKVSGMNLDCISVRPKRKQVEPFLEREYWDQIDECKHIELENHISSLPSEAEPYNEHEQDKHLSNRFDNLVLTLQLDLLQKAVVGNESRERVMEFAYKLEGKTTIPQVLAQLDLIQEVQTLEFWQDVHLSALEDMRRRLRNLVLALDKESKDVVYTNFKDEVQGVRDVTAVYTTPGLDLVQYRKKTEAYIKEHQDHVTIQKLKRNKPITQSDLDVLENLLLDASGVSDAEEYREKVLQDKPLGKFIRELVGLDINAAKEAFSDFLDEGIYNAQQINFINKIIDYLMHNGVLDMAHIFEPPFTDEHHEGAYGFFDEGKVVELFGRIREVNANADADNDVA